MTADLSDVLLTTKVRLPMPRGEVVVRPRLVTRLEAGLTRALTVLAAPAGFGKTTLLSAWLAQREASLPRFGWLALDREDDDLARFWHYVCVALQTIAPGLGATAHQWLHSGASPRAEGLLTALANDLAASPGPVGLVLDDYHFIESDAIHTGLDYLLDHAPPNFHLVLATRVDPPLSLSRRRARGELAEIRAADLRFAPAEAAEFLNTRLALGLSGEDIDLLTARTEGWGVGLRLASLSLLACADKHAFITALAGDDSYIADYLADEVLHRQPPEMQTFLLRTSILDRLSAPLCAALLRPAEPAAAAASLDDLESANLFVSALDSRRQWYRYHPLWADLLRNRLERTQPEWVPELHRRASAWFEQQGLLAEAVHHALAAGEVEHAAALLERLAPQRLVRAEISLLLRELRRLPEAQVLDRPNLALSQAWACLLLGQGQAVEPLLQALEQRLARRPAPPPELAIIQGEISAVRALRAYFDGELAATVALARQALTQLPPNNVSVRGLACLSLGGALEALGQTGEAAEALASARQLCYAARNLFGGVSATYFLARLLSLQGELREAARLLQAELAQEGAAPDAERRPGFLQGIFHIGLGALSYERNDLAAAEEHLRRSLQLCGADQPADMIAYAHAMLARVHQARGQPAEAQARMEKACQVARETGSPAARLEAETLQARLWLAQGNRSAAEQWAAAQGRACAHDLAAAELIDPRREPLWVVFARLLLAQAQPAPALALLERLEPAARSARRLGRALEVAVLKALALDAVGQTAPALAALDAVWDLAEAETYVRSFVDEGEPLRRLLVKAGRQSERPSRAAYLARLLAAFATATPAAAPAPGKAQGARLAGGEPLSARELEMLGLLALGLSNALIARKLHISLNTVKTHTRHIYEKLGATNRTQAVALARAAGLLAAD